MHSSGSPYVGSGQPGPLESFTALYLQLLKHCVVETRLWFDLMEEHALKTYRAMMARKPRHYVLACLECHKDLEKKLREQLSNTPFYRFCVWKFEDMASALIWYINKHCQNRSLKLDNPMMWLLKNLVWYHLIVEDAWYSDRWKDEREYDEKKIYSGLWDRVESAVYKTGKYKKRLSAFIKESCEGYLARKTT
jgi:hypothetical protein